MLSMRWIFISKLFKFWSITPYAGTRQTYYSRNRWGDTNIVRGIFEAGLDKNLFNVFNQVRERRDCPPEPCNRFCNVAPMRVSARTPCPRPTRRRAATTT